MIIDWCQCILKSRCRLKIINLNNEYFDDLIGVYVIWSGNDEKNIVSVGQGKIREKLIEMQIDQQVQSYGPDLFVTWAAVPKASLEGVEAFLCDELNPTIHRNITNNNFVTVNLP